MSSTTLWLPSRLLGFVNVLYLSSFANLFNHPKAARKAGNCPLRWLNETGLERWAREMDPAPSLIMGETNRQLQRDPIDFLGISIPLPRLTWPFELFQLSPRRTRPELESTPSRDHTPSHSPTPSSEQRPRAPPPPKEKKEKKKLPTPPRGRDSTIHKLMQNPALRDPLRAPRYPIVLCHGLYGFDVRGPSAIPALRMHYWSDVRNILRKTVGADLIIGSVPGTGSIASRAAELDRFLQTRARGRGVNLLAHSMGGLDGRHLITHIRPREYAPLSLTTVGTPHRGSPFMDWCQDYLGIGRIKDDAMPTKAPPKTAEWDEVEDLPPWPTEHDSPSANSYSSGPSASWFSVPSSSSSPSLSDPQPRSSTKESSTASKSALASLSLSSLPGSLTMLLLGMFDSPAYGNLSTDYLEHVFNPRTPDDPRIRYFSVGGRAPRLNVWHPLWLPKLVVDGWEEKERERAPNNDDLSGWGNDGLVTVRSARWGEYLGTLHDSDHWRLRGAGGFELGEHLSVPSLGLVSNQFSWLARAFGREAQEEQRSAEEKESEAARERALGDEGKAQEDQQSADALRRSTERLSEMVDWIVDSVPTEKIPTLSFTKDAVEKEQAEVEREKKEKEENLREKGDLESDEDLEQFYIALARKLYDEGL
ncbi:alpha/beta-hydrolase [Peniophora sp. CONT]|nr:alpha/beta-hydrolase [Peniophora sp. CONT]